MEQQPKQHVQMQVLAGGAVMHVIQRKFYYFLFYFNYLVGDGFNPFGIPRNSGADDSQACRIHGRVCFC
jgi:hypothetical protein